MTPPRYASHSDECRNMSIIGKILNTRYQWITKCGIITISPHDFLYEKEVHQKTGKVDQYI